MYKSKTNLRNKNQSRIKKVDDLVYPELSYKIVGVLFDVHNKLGAGLQEKHYQKAVAEALREEGLQFEEQVRISLKFDEKKIGDYYLDFLVENKIIIELKTKRFAKEYYSQISSYLKATGIKLGIVAELKFRRIVNLY